MCKVGCNMSTVILCKACPLTVSMQRCTWRSRKVIEQFKHKTALLASHKREEPIQTKNSSFFRLTMHLDIHHVMIT